MEIVFSLEKYSLIVKTDTWLWSVSSGNQRIVCIRFITVSGYNYESSIGQKVKLNYSVVAIANSVHPPRSSEAWMPLNSFPGWSKGARTLYSGIKQLLNVGFPGEEDEAVSFS